MDEASENVKELLHSAHTTGMNKWMNEQTNEWMNKWMNEQMNEWTDAWMNKQMNEWVNKQMNRWMNEQTNEWMSSNFSSISQKVSFYNWSNFMTKCMYVNKKQFMDCSSSRHSTRHVWCSVTKLYYLSVHFYHLEFTDLNPLLLRCFNLRVIIFTLHNTALACHAAYTHITTVQCTGHNV
jgi:hypothetical protein